MGPILEAAFYGNVAAIDRFVQEDRRRLNAQIQGYHGLVNGLFVEGCSPLMLAAWNGYDAAVAQLLALGADVRLEDSTGRSALLWACMGDDNNSVVALLLDAGAPVNPRNHNGATPLYIALKANCSDCVELLIERGGDALDVDVDWDDGQTALHYAAEDGHTNIVRQLLQAGADPTIRNDLGKTPLDEARSAKSQVRYPSLAYVLLLEAALIEPQRSRLLFKARALIATRRTVMAATAALASKDLPAVLCQGIIAMAIPPYLVGRVAQGQELPRVFIDHNGDDKEEQLMACVKYALGLDGGGGVVFEGQGPTVGMLPEVFVELLEQLVPQWDTARKGRVLGDGYIEVGEDMEEGDDCEYVDDDEDGDD